MSLNEVIITHQCPKRTINGASTPYLEDVGEQQPQVHKCETSQLTLTTATNSSHKRHSKLDQSAWLCGCIGKTSLGVAG